jgi:SAM-dependent methyltransferase
MGISVPAPAHNLQSPGMGPQSSPQTVSRTITHFQCHGVPMTDSADSKSSVYIHGSTAPEQARLSRLNQLMNEAAMRELAIPKGVSILDVGCGLGQLSRDMARASGPGVKAVGVERDPIQLSKAVALAAEMGESSMVDFRLGDATHLPLTPAELGTFDLTHARFILEHVPDPLAVVRQMMQATRPGGRIVLQDDDHDVLRLWPEPAGFAALWGAYMQSYRGLGNDPFVGRRLVELLVQAGAQPRRNTWIFFGSCAGQENFDSLVENLIVILQGAMACILQQNLLNAKTFRAAMRELDRWITRPDASFWYAICYVEGIK